MWSQSLEVIYASVQRPEAADSAISMVVEAEVGRLEQLLCDEEAADSPHLSQERYAPQKTAKE